MLTVEDLRAGYKSREIVHGISLHVAPATVAALLGTNGAGKSTTLGAIMGSVKRFSGRILLDGADITRNETADNVLAGISLVPEGGRVFRAFSVHENLNLGAYNVQNPKVIQQRMTQVMTLFPILGRRLQQQAGTLSGGERQMLAIGRALMAGPRVLLLDEPFLGLAPAIIDMVCAAIQQINREHSLTLLVVEQNPQILTVANHAYIMRLGEIIISEEEPATLLHDDRLETVLIGG